MAPKRRYASGTIMDLCVGLSVLVFNDGHQALLKLLKNLCGTYGGIFLIASSYTSFSLGDSSGYYSSLIFKRLDKDREEREEKKAKRKDRSKPEIKLRDEMVDQVTDDAYISGAF